MTEKELQDFFPFLCRHRVRRQNEVRVDALSRMYIAVGDLPGSASLQGFDLRRKLVRKIDSLYNALDGSSIPNLRRMYRLTKEFPAVCAERDEACRTLCYNLLDRYMKHPNPEEEIEAMRCIVYELGGILEDNTGFDYYGYFLSTCRRWIAELADGNHWPGLPVETALQRLELLQDNYYVFRDGRFNDALLRVYARYRKQFVLPERVASGQLPLLGAWYDLLCVPGLFPEEAGLLKRIAGLLEDFAAAEKFRSDAWYYAVSYAVVQGCADVSDCVNAA